MQSRNRLTEKTNLWLPTGGEGERRGHTRSLGLTDMNHYILKLDKQQGFTV